MISLAGLRAVLLDIEGTTTPIAFVHDVLFPYARVRLASYLGEHQDSPEIGEVLRLLATEHAENLARGEHPPRWLARGVEAGHDSVVAFAEWLMDRDRKSPGLKLLQGLIWERGYRAGELHGQVFADVPAAIRRWRDAGLRIAIYSSGSELAQRRLFESTEYGDLAPQLSGFFDTAVGAKGSPDSYRRIAARLGLEPAAILFVSDVTTELDAASEAGLRVALSVRPGNGLQPANTYDVIGSFTEIAG